MNVDKNNAALKWRYFLMGNQRTFIFSVTKRFIVFSPAKSSFYS